MDTEPRELDHIDKMLVVWAREIPDLDPLTEGIVERIQILAKAFDRSMDETLGELGLERRAYYLLGRLRSHGAPYRRTPGQLAAEMRLSSGAMTNRLDRMEEAGLIRRLPDPTDRRGTLVEPTEAGHAAWDRTVGTQARREAMFASVLDVPEREELQRLLRRLMRAFPDKGHPCEPDDAQPTEGTAPTEDAAPAKVTVATDAAAPDRVTSPA
jgi:DNA-binding MarR family transcriptional regulator